MPEFYALANVTVSLSDSDGFPQSLLESMAACTPSVVGRIPELDGQISHEEHVLFAEFDNDSISAGLLRLLSDCALRERLIATGLSFVRDDANLERNAVRVHNRLQEAVLSPRNVRRRSWAVMAAILCDSLLSRISGGFRRLSTRQRTNMLH